MVRLLTLYEKFFAKFATAHLTVTKAMRKEILGWGYYTIL